MQSMDRGMRMLEILAEQPMRAKDLADTLGAKWATVHRTLVYLREAGYVKRDEATGLHYVGRRIFKIGTAYLSDHPLYHSTEPLMRPVAANTRGFVQIAERDGKYSVAIASVEPTTATPGLTYASVGRSYPLHTGARGLVLLAHAPQSFVDEYLSEPLKALTEFSITDPAKIRDKIEEIRGQGYATSSRDVSVSSIGIAAPVRDSTGDVSACAAIINYRERVPEFDEWLEAVLGLATSLSRILGYRSA